MTRKEALEQATREIEAALKSGLVHELFESEGLPTDPLYITQEALKALEVRVDELMAMYQKAEGARY
jgi:hypothetical protein